jgi:hypothetical protein
MSDVFVFGAGASMNYRGAYGSLFCDQNFFQVIEEIWAEWGKPDNKPEHYNGSPWDWPKLRRRIEQVCAKPILSIGLEEAFGRIDGLGEPWEGLFCRGIELALFWRIRGTRRQNLQSHVDFLQRVLRPGSTIITFNYDPLLEYALGHLDSVGISWKPSTGYGLRFEGEFSTGELKVMPAESESNVQLLKLHGSMNWLVLADEWPHPPRWLLWLTTHNFGGPGHVCMREARTGAVLRPLFLPPKPAKDYEIVGLSNLWEKAGRALADASSLTVIGYRFPETDAAARDLIRKAEHLRDSDRVTYVTLNDPEAEQTFRDHFPKVSVFTKGFAAYVKHLDEQPRRAPYQACTRY